MRATGWVLVAASLAVFWAIALVARHELLTPLSGAGPSRVLIFVAYLLITVVSLRALIVGRHLTEQQVGLRGAAVSLRPAIIYVTVVSAAIVAWLWGWVWWGSSLGPEQREFATDVMQQFAQLRLANGIGSSPASIWAAVVVFGAVGAFAEEVIYRSILQTAIASRFGNRIAVVCSTAVFVVAHVWIYGYSYGGWPMEPILLGGLLGLLFARHRSLLVVTAVHLTWNMTITVTAALLARG